MGRERSLPHGGLACWAHPFVGLYYNTADGLRLLGIALAFRERWIAAAVALALAFCTHPVMALMGILFLLPLMESRILLPGNRDGRRNATLGALVFCLFAGSWWAFALRNTELSGATGDEAWLASARVFSFHFFPVDYGLLTREHHERLIPFLALMILTWHYLRRAVWDSVRGDVTRGLIVLAVATAAGFALSEISTSPTLIKLALHRASDVMILVGLVIVSSGLLDDLLYGSWWQRLLALALGASPFVLKPGLPLLLAWLLVLAPAGSGVNARPQKGTRSIRIGVGFTMILAAAYGVQGYIGPTKLPAYLGNWHLLRLTVLGFVGLVASRWVAVRFRRFDLPALAIALSILWLAHKWQLDLPMSRENAALASDYFQAQLWARNETSPYSLFLVDPTIYYGWRDYSRRSSTGNLREWLHTGWLYDSRQDRYVEGLRRLRVFGLDFHAYTGPPPSWREFERLTKQLERSFYGLPEPALAALARKWGADHVVVLRAKAAGGYRASAAFSNEHVAIYRTAALAAAATPPSSEIVPMTTAPRAF